MHSNGISSGRMSIAGLLAVFLALPVGGAAPTSTAEQQLGPYLTPQLAVPVGKGRTINLVCLGNGSPTVILSAGLDAWSVWWWAVQPAIAKQTRVCAWDRAGFGFSSSSPEPQDIAHTTDDLERALRGAGIEGPYVMVGHSLGGLEALRFTDLHPQSVIGMVLVDPDIPDRASIEDRIAPQFATISRANAEQHVKHLQDCAAELRDGTLKRSTPEFERCTGVPAPLDPRLEAAIARLNADPQRLLTQASTENEHYADCREVTNGRRRYGDMPLVVLTAGLDESSALSALRGTQGASTAEEIEQLRKQIVRFLHAAWGPAHEAYAALSTRGRNQIVPDSGHNIPINKPEVVISAIIEVLNETQTRPAARVQPAPPWSAAARPSGELTPGGVRQLEATGSP
jgi:pimeloyl-ACP methyl ester carboxylesterase